ncbi:MAG: hypothetical protein IKN86_04585 [Bacteroidaceae bacterium]|nr:hypothetical protein [Bacteroidaceae bacterium]
MKRIINTAVRTAITLILTTTAFTSCQSAPEIPEQPCIINFVNFIRQVEPRDERFTNEYLFQTTANELAQLNEYGFRGTFLLQYDALVDSAYQQLMREAKEKGHEVGAWWEITEPHVRDAGMTWRGRYPWDWHANVGFATGYTPEERERLVDTYMNRFHEIFGSYPESVGSWFIDAHTLQYFSDKYGITASCNCKDQYGTDGYTLWGGYWNQAYYPSRVNAYMPAQTSEGQIPVPVFRMLGSDPVLQYDNALDSRVQGVITLEPVYTGNGGGGGNRQWIEWFLPAMANSKSLGFNYIQAGQENSFGWEAMKNGLTMQMPIIRQLADEGKVRVETLAESGRWFKERYPLTPATSVTVDDDFLHDGRSAAWYDSRFYRIGLFWEGDFFVIRDIHLFDESIESDYLRQAGTSTQCVYTTLPIVDGYLWSTSDERAGLRLVALQGESGTEEIPVFSHSFRQTAADQLVVDQKTPYGTFTLTLNEDNITCSLRAKKKVNWAMEFTAAPKASLPFDELSAQEMRATWKGHPYAFHLQKGSFETASSSSGKPTSWRMHPQRGKIVLSCQLSDKE